MSIIGWAVTALIPGAGIAGAVAKFGARLVFGKVGAGLKSAGGFIAANWKPVAIIGGIAAAVVYILILHGELRHRDKTIAGQAALIGQVKAEVDRGVGQPTRAEQASIWIRRFVDNVNVLDRALDREAAALRQSHANGEQARADTIALSKATPAQQQREKDRQKIVSGAGALTPDDWSKL